MQKYRKVVFRYFFLDLAKISSFSPDFYTILIGGPGYKKTTNLILIVLILNSKPYSFGFGSGSHKVFKSAPLKTRLNS